MYRIRWLIVIAALLAGAGMLSAQDTLAISSGDVVVTSGGQAYESYLAAPAAEGVYPAIVLIHSFNGMEQGYRDMTDAVAAEGFVVLAVGWQTFDRQPSDDTVQQLLRDSVAFLSARDDVDAARIGLTGFCAGGRYTMLFLPQIAEFSAGVAWYGFPNRGAPSALDLVAQLDAPMLIIHGTADAPSPIADIYAYAAALDAAGKSFELKVYQGEPHGFMLENSALRTDEVAADALDEMVQYFRRKL